jgi:hypothetical protein
VKTRLTAGDIGSITAAESANSQNGLDFSVYLGSLTRQTAFNGGRSMRLGRA